LTIKGKSRELELLLKAQIKQGGYTQNGLKYKTTGHRMSGEYTTSDGNSLLNYAMLIVWCKQSNIEHYRICVNGDDSVVIIEREDFAKLKPLSFFNNFNMETEMDRAVTDFQRISYCQSSPIRVMKDGELKWYMVKEPRRSISRLCYTDYNHLNSLPRIISSIGLCELAISSGVPLMQAVALKILRAGELAKPLGGFNKYPAAISGNDIEFKPILDVTRQDFEIAFGIDMLEQINTEASIAGYTNILPTEYNYITKYKRYNQLNNAAIKATES